jgi:ubiquinone/menaquinone biosynthesis C-methylase UbiE
MKNSDTIKEFVRQSDFSVYLDNLSRGYMSSRIFLTALELNLFETIGMKQLHVSEISKQIDTDPRATEVLLNALVGLGLLEKKGNLFSNTKYTADFLISGKPDYKGAMFQHHANLWTNWSELTKTLKSGNPINCAWNIKRSQDLAIAMKAHAREKAEKIVKLVDYTQAKRMLDLGGGAGSYSIAFARAYPCLNISLFDMDEWALEIARKEILDEGFQDRIHLKKGDVFNDDFGNKYDLVFMSYMTCLFSEEQNRFLLKKIHGVLNENGLVAICDAIINENKTLPSLSSIFAVNMLVTTLRGRLYSESEIIKWLVDIGFYTNSSILMDSFQLITARK